VRLKLATFSSDALGQVSGSYKFVETPMIPFAMHLELRRRRGETGDGPELCNCMYNLGRMQRAKRARVRTNGAQLSSLSLVSMDSPEEQK
jgi:hypothetical protein